MKSKVQFRLEHALEAFEKDLGLDVDIQVYYHQTQEDEKDIGQVVEKLKKMLPEYKYMFDVLDVPEADTQCDLHNFYSPDKKRRIKISLFTNRRALK